MERQSAVAALSALAQETRLDIFRLLVRAGAEGLPAGRIGEALGLPWPTLSFHLSQLKQAGLVTARREGRSIFHAADYAAMGGLMAFLTENCCESRPHACAASTCAPESPVNPKGGFRHEAFARARRR